MPSPPIPHPPANQQDLAQLTAGQWAAVIAGDPTGSLAWMRAAALLGHAQAQAVLGQWMLNGHGAPRNAEEALQWFLKAAGQKHAMGMNMAGRCYENGWGTKINLEQALYWFRQAAELGLDVGMYNYANQLAAGKSIAQDHVKALGWYSQAASQGHAKSMTKAGRYFERGIVVTRDLAKALSCYRQGAEGGDFRGQFCYAGMLAAQGNVAEALVWLRKVPETATAAYMREAGQLLLDSPSEEVRQIGQQMLERAGRAALSPL